MKSTALRSTKVFGGGRWHRVGLLLAWPLMFSGSPASCQTTFWVADGVGNWNVPLNWSAGVPSASNDVQINNGGTARLFDPNGSAQGVFLGFNSGNTGTLEVLGGTAQVEFAFVGFGGQGTLKVANGGKVFSFTSSFNIIGDLGGSSGVAIIDGLGSMWQSSSDLFVGLDGTGSLSIQNGGGVSNTKGYVGQGPLSNGTVTVNGASSSWLNTGDLFVGNSGTGALNITGGGLVSNIVGKVGEGSSSSGAVTVNGVNSRWQNSSIVNVGVSGTGTLNINSGGAVTNLTASLGSNNGASGSATVDGLGSTWTNDGDLAIGRAGTGALSITGGGRTSNQNGNIGVEPGANGMVIVDGSDSVWFNHSVVAVGVSGTAALSITGGGQVTSFHGRIGREVGSTGTVVVDGPGSAWNISDQLTIGLSDKGTGTLSVQNGGRVSAAVVTVGPNATVQGNGAIVANVTNTGRVAPGASAGALQVTGNYWQFIGGKLQIELASPTSFDKLAVTGNVTLEPDFGFGLGSGPLEVSLTGGYVPHGSQSFDILDWTGSLSGTFSSIQLPTLGGTLVWDTSQVYTTGVLSVVGPPAPFEADFDEDGDVDAADLARWKPGFGAGATHMQGDADADGDVDGADFLTWQRQLGSAPVSASSAIVPEPPSRILLMGFTAVGVLTRSGPLRRKPLVMP